MNLEIVAGPLKFSFAEEFIGFLVVLAGLFFIFKVMAAFLNSSKELYQGNKKLTNEPNITQAVNPLKAFAIALSIFAISILLLVWWASRS